jgi:hypothetical protein
MILVAESASSDTDTAGPNMPEDLNPLVVRQRRPQ